MWHACIPTVVPIGPLDRQALIERIEGLQPRGMTPLTDAVRHAAEELEYRDQPGTVVLISDGIESCDADPCAVAGELARAGIRFTAHVVGFDIPDGADLDQLRCIADNTGGRFFTARDASGLQAALVEVRELAAEPEPPEAQVELDAPDRAIAGSDVSVSWTGEDIHHRDLVTIVPADADASARGSYRRVGEADSATLTTPGETGAHEVRYVSSATGRAVATRAIELTEAEIHLESPESVTAGADFTVAWSGSVHHRDYITIVPAGAPDEQVDNYQRARDHSRTTLTAPGEPGDYEVRYLLNENRSVLARSVIRVTDAGVDVSAPAEVSMGAEFPVEWSQVVHHRDYITIVPVDAPESEIGTYQRARNDNRNTLTAPAVPGDYEVRYVLNEERRILGRTPVTVIEASVELSAPDEVMIGSDFPVEWSHTIHHRDYITIVPVDAPESESGNYQRARDFTQSSLTAPAEAGNYEVRYLLNEGRRVIGRTAVRLVEVEVSIEAPATVEAGQDIPVTWSPTVHHRDYVTVVSPDAPPGERGGRGYYKRAGSGDSATLQAPDEPGDYEIRYVLNEGGRMLGRVSIRVE